jgi:hypothetical protein
MKQAFAARGGLAGIAPRPRVTREDSETTRGRSHSLVAWLALIGLIIPANEVQIFIGGAKFTVGRIGIVLVLVPAIVTLLQKGRRLLASDFFILATATWMVGAALYTDGTAALSSAGAEALELFGGYLVARAYFFGPAALHTFLRVLRVLAFIAIVFAIADRASGQLLIHHTFASLLHVPSIDDQLRMGTIRAASTFDHAILFGAFCAVVAAMLLYSEANVLKRNVYVGFCLLGVILSISSSGRMAFAIMAATYMYDRLMKQYSWRWSAIWIVLGVSALAILLVTNHPLGWILTHLTLDPESAYFRLLEWDAASYQISLSPWTGHAFADFGTGVLYSVDCVWLVLALRFGLPAPAFFLLANIAAVLPVRHSAHRAGRSYMDKMSTAVSLVLVMYMFVGLTTHYWNYMWIFWGICIGIRASLREYSMAVGRRRSAAGFPTETNSSQLMADAIKLRNGRTYPSVKPLS